MKYIRTKDGVYGVYTKDLDLNDKTHRDIAGFRAQHCRGWNYSLKPKDIVKVADTIEELCDEFVCLEGHSLLKPTYTKFNDEGYTTQTYHDGILNAFRRGFNYISYHWVGAIWTDKSLIYVAKMNDKGELELL